MTKDDLFKMELNSAIEVNKDLTILRVLSGWIYHYKNNNVFVPSRIEGNRK
jgi:hypothetical protein